MPLFNYENADYEFEYESETIGEYNVLSIFVDDRASQEHVGDHFHLFETYPSAIGFLICI